MNKNKDKIAKNLQKRVAHIIMPKSIWRKFDHWRIDAGFATTPEALRFLVRQVSE
jgi:hypothetical protein